MSSKITSKNLHYNAAPPPFLARLQANHASQDGRQEIKIARPKKARNAEDEAEDEPVYFDEGTGESLTRGEWEAREKEEEVRKGGGEEEGDGKRDGGEKGEGERLAGMGGSRKRKVGRVVGGDEEEEGKEQGVKPEKRKVEKGKDGKKGTKVKLSFGDDD